MASKSLSFPPFSILGGGDGGAGVDAATDQLLAVDSQDAGTSQESLSSIFGDDGVAAGAAAAAGGNAVAGLHVPTVLKRLLFFDTECTGFPVRPYGSYPQDPFFHPSQSHHYDESRLLSISCVLVDSTGRWETYSALIKHEENIKMDKAATRTHGLTLVSVLFSFFHFFIFF